MADRRARFERLLRVRTLQLGLARAGEVQANARVAQEQGLHDRIAQLSAAVAPQVAPAPAGATGFAAAAFYRERLQHSAASAVRRVAIAEQGLAEAHAATAQAKRDQSAAEKLIARADADALRRDLRALEDLPPTGSKTAR